MHLTSKQVQRFPDADTVVGSLEEPSEEDRVVGQLSNRVDDRVKTRFLNFRVSRSGGAPRRVVPRGQPRSQGTLALLTIVDGPGTGKQFEITSEFVQIGRAPDQDVQLDFGDTSISRSCHASIAHYGGYGAFTLRDGLKPNPVLVNGARLNGERSVRSGDLIQIGQTTLRFEGVELTQPL